MEIPHKQRARLGPRKLSLVGRANAVQDPAFDILKARRYRRAAEPFELCQGVTILDPARWWRSIEGDIEAGPNGPRARYGAVQGDLRRLYDLIRRVYPS